MTVNASISDGSTVIYNNVITNVGHPYDTTSGTFTAPLEGTYVFHFHALSHVDKVSYTMKVYHQGYWTDSSTPRIKPIFQIIFYPTCSKGTQILLTHSMGYFNCFIVQNFIRKEVKLSKFKSCHIPKNY